MSQAGVALPRCDAVVAERRPLASSPCPPERRVYVLVTAVLASSLGFIDGSVVAVALPSIRAALGADFATAQWVANAYMLTLASLILVGGAAGDRYGVRRVFALGVAAFALTSLACALTPTPGLLVAARACQGAAAALMVPGSLALIAKNIPKAERGRAIGVWSAAAGLTTALGPPLGGWIVGIGGDAAWRWIFAINLPIGAVTLFLLLYRVPHDAAEGGGALDVAGAALTILGLGSLAFALTAGAEGGIGPILIVSAVVVGIAALVGFVVWEGHAARPMVPLAMFKDRAFSGANGLTFLLYTALSGVLFYLPMTLIAGLGTTAATAGSVFLPFTLVMAVLARYAGTLADKRGLRLPLTLGPAITGVAFLLLALAVESGSFWFAVMPAMLVLGVGMGLAVTPLSTAVVASADDRQSGTASGINNAVARIASLFAVAGLGLVAAFAYQAAGGGASGVGFGAPVDGLSLGDAADASLATRHGFAAVAVATGLLAFAAAAVAWVTQPGEAVAG